MDIESGLNALTALLGVALTPATAAPASAPTVPVADSGSSSLWDGSAHMSAPGQSIVTGLAVLFCGLAALAPGSSAICAMDLNPRVLT
ncbi:hypothetical protein D7D52_02105 [Nocardia yunnanensis]|uniref:Uncharacterized protein n=1 Tax=Nocardia yunnanensis TaxID=2382165 RepID=A0A386Z566_9NOCA|nr:hypothetical protein [Nocardia yunnanensis]AYF72858.1 hypothetical protein D7D52_02105 [Nocardia yunnanensis]